MKSVVKHPVCVRRNRRTPHGVRGLKFGNVTELVHYGSSHPTRGAWIEIRLPVQALAALSRRTPHGVRGLK